MGHQDQDGEKNNCFQTAEYLLSPHIKTIAVDFLRAEVSSNKNAAFCYFKKKGHIQTLWLIFKDGFRV